VEGWLPPAEVDGDGPRPSLAGSVRALRSALVEGEEYDLALEGLLGVLAARSPPHPLLNATLARLLAGPRRLTAYPAGVILSARVRPGFHPGSPDGGEAGDGTDEDDSSSLRGGTLAPTQVELTQHTAGVERWVETFSVGLGLGGDVRAILRRA